MSMIQEVQMLLIKVITITVQYINYIRAVSAEDHLD